MSPPRRTGVDSGERKTGKGQRSTQSCIIELVTTRSQWGQSQAVRSPAECTSKRSTWDLGRASIYSLAAGLHWVKFLILLIGARLRITGPGERRPRIISEREGAAEAWGWWVTPVHSCLPQISSSKGGTRVHEPGHMGSLIHVYSTHWYVCIRIQIHVLLSIHIKYW